MAPKRKRTSSVARSTTKKNSVKKSTKRINKNKSIDKHRTNSKDTKDVKRRPIKTKGDQQIKYHTNEEVQYDPVHKGSSRRTQGKIKKVLTGAKKSDPSTKEIRYVIENDNTGKETIYGQHSIVSKVEE